MGRHMNTVEQTEIWDRYEAGQTFTEIAASRTRARVGFLSWAVFVGDGVALHHRIPLTRRLRKENPTTLLIP